MFHEEGTLSACYGNKQCKTPKIQSLLGIIKFTLSQSALHLNDTTNKSD